MNQTDIPPSLDEFGDHKKIIPAEVRGRFRRRRTWTQVALIVFFLFGPWIRFRGEQLFLLDIFNRKFHFFGWQLYSHDAPLIFLVFAIFAFGLIFITAVWGRLFCGWACPQTVFIDGVFRRIEIWIEGPYLKRRKEATTPMNRQKLGRKLLKWLLFVITSSAIAHSFVAFFAGSDVLIQMMSQDPRQNWTYFILISAITLIILFDFAIFREQFCLIVCPYGRFQSVLLDRLSLNIAYDVQRGEPRKGAPTQALQKTGDCVSCNRCVEVCPTGIDIRNGLQMECIACTACIDACDEIMEKVHKPPGLIRYMNSSGSSQWTLKSPRVIGSAVIILISVAIIASALIFREDIDVVVIRGRDALFQEQTVNGLTFLSNHFKLHIKNQTQKNISLKISGTSNSTALEIATPENPLPLKPGQDREVHLFVKFAKQDFNPQALTELQFHANGEVLNTKTIHLVGPAQ